MTAPVTGTFAGAGGVRLFRQTWPADGASGVLVNVHGLGDHSGLYPFVTRFFPAHGWSVAAFDTRGNGRSPGRRGHVDRWHEFRDDLRAFLDVVRTEAGDRPVVLLGHSLGALMAIDLALEHPDGLHGVALAAPPLGEVGVPAPLLLLARLLTRVWPTYSRVTGMDLSNLARDPAIVATLVEDPLFHRAATARLGTETLDTIASVHARAARLAVPVLILHGTGDRMVPIAGSRQFASGPAAPRVTLREYPDAGHALFVDLGYEERLRDLLDWMRSPRRAAGDRERRRDG